MEQDVVDEKTHSLRKIQVLAPRLANQIAAGEVVERPASVVKELIENSLDAGADRIEVEIERGGHKLIRIRDNGCGVPKEELELALSRHATSKIASLDDLEAICSLGFRGEALASVSSVSRLTLTSRTAGQTEAWECYAQGRDMAVVIRPAAHPVGTTVSVDDLFFNTPARRKFLRTEKTEFAHIDELVKRIALSRFELQLVLKHNGKIVRHFRAARDQKARERRLAEVFNAQFIDSCLYFENQHHDLKIWGWLGSPEASRAQSDWQYCYVNGRMMRDKLINHAVRQAFGDAIGASSYPAYLLYIELPAAEVDVNVHPAKHEVRFHQARLVHDYIVQVIEQALYEGRRAEPDLAGQWQTPQPCGGFDGVKERHHYRYMPDLNEVENRLSRSTHKEESASRSSLASPKDADARQLKGYQAFLQASLSGGEAPAPHTAEDICEAAMPETPFWGKILFSRLPLLLIQKEQRLYWLELVQLLVECRALNWLTQWQSDEVVVAPLLLPVRVDAGSLPDLTPWLPGIARLGVTLSLCVPGKVIITQLPASLREVPALELLQLLAQWIGARSEQECDLFCRGELEHQPLLALMKKMLMLGCKTEKLTMATAQEWLYLASLQGEICRQVESLWQGKSSQLAFIEELDPDAILARFLTRGSDEA